tara:strand:- start:72 stop:218 length:147 start_codon:yes stop_codon:yes gene_type:complete
MGQGSLPCRLKVDPPRFMNPLCSGDLKKAAGVVFFNLQIQTQQQTTAL